MHPSTLPDQADDPDFLFNQLIAQAKATVAARTKGTPGKPIPSEEGMTAWTETGYVLLLTETHCRCGAVYHSPEGVFVERKPYRHTASESRTLHRIPVSSIVGSLPRAREVRRGEVDVCAACARGFGS